MKNESRRAIGGFFVFSAFFTKMLAGMEKVRIFAETESATLPDDQRTRAGLLLSNMRLKPRNLLRLL